VRPNDERSESWGESWGESCASVVRAAERDTMVMVHQPRVL
jgi:hypothetical protein